MRDMLIAYPTTKNIWCHLTNTTRSRFMEFFLVLLYHAIPGFLYDVVLRFTNNPRRLLPLYRKTHMFMVWIGISKVFIILLQFQLKRRLIFHFHILFRQNYGISWHKNGDLAKRICTLCMTGMVATSHLFLSFCDWLWFCFAFSFL